MARTPLEATGPRYSHLGTIRANVKQMKARWVVDQDNVRYFDALVANRGIVFTLDVRPYIDCLTAFGINFTAPRTSEPL